MGNDRGVDLMIDAAQRVGGRTRREVLWLFVGGEARQIEGWERLAREHRLGPETYRFAGFRPQSELPRWYAASDILCAPYRSRVGTRDVMSPMKLFEYLAAGKVIVAADIPTIRDVVGQSDAAYLVEPDSAAAIADAVLAIERGPRHFERMAESARARGMRATWAHKSEELLRWLGSVGVAEYADPMMVRRSATG
jgi:glycosyltransferase involved in cell wall biosynthesis